MSRTIQDENLSRKLDAFFDAGRDLAKELVSTWLESRSDQANGDQAETSTRSTAERETAQGDEPLMNVEEMASYLNVKPQTLRSWAKRGRIPYEPVNSEIRFRRSVVDKWIDENRIKKSSPHSNDTVVKFDRSILRPANHRSKSNGRV